MSKTTLLVIFMLIASSYAALAQVCPFYTTEGQLLKITTEGYDPDTDIGPAGRLIWTYPLPFNEAGEWQTYVGDAGVYHLTFGLSDGEFTDSFSACLEVFSLSKVVVKPKKIEYNNPPLLIGLKNVKMYVGDTLHLRIRCLDIDGDDLDLTYYGWPSERDHTATIEEVGTHISEVVCRDSRGGETRQQMTIQVVPRSAKPVITLDHIIVYEGEVVDLTKYVYDLDTPKDALRFEATGIFEKSLVWYTMKGDAGNYTTILSVSDGQNLVSKGILVEVLERPPENIEVRYPAQKEDISADDFVLAQPRKEETAEAEEECEPQPCPLCEINILVKAIQPAPTGDFWSVSSPLNRC
ncbi:MAG: hypothetical protein KJ574_01805 [Nanoarchaeota archaeon]|nr:hypothetical protein [Nanoarchaeota archaeon]